MIIYTIYNIYENLEYLTNESGLLQPVTSKLVSPLTLESKNADRIFFDNFAIKCSLVTIMQVKKDDHCGSVSKMAAKS